ncbi:MAG TPA: response regulator transcription factor [Solirubrobacterales bacterium]|nr:response regulator transcription factor [Solirubrobacterales bacterium]
MAERPPAIVLAEDEPVTRTALRRLLENAGFEVTAEAGDAEAAIESSLRERPQLCLVDLYMPGGGIRVVREVSRRVQEASVVVLTASEDRDDMIEAIRAGASGYLVKNMNLDRIAPALRGVLAGEAAIPRSLMAALVRDLQTEGRKRLIAGRHGRADLTRREWEILGLMCDGLSGPSIAERLYISPVTVRRHCGEVVRKLGVRDRGEAIALVQEHS